MGCILAEMSALSPARLWPCLRQLYRPGYRYKKTGVVLLELGPDQQVQADLFAAPPSPRRAKLMETLYQRYGLKTVCSGAHWQMRQDRQSPRYTHRVVGAAGGPFITIAS